MPVGSASDAQMQTGGDSSPQHAVMSRRSVLYAYTSTRFARSACVTSSLYAHADIVHRRAQGAHGQENDPEFPQTP